MSFIVSYCICMEPLVRGYMATKPASMMILHRTRLSAFVVFNDLFRSFLAGEAILLWGCQSGRTVLRLGRRTLVLPLQRDDASWTGHLKRKRCIMRYCVKAGESFASQ